MIGIQLDFARNIFKRHIVLYHTVTAILLLRCSSSVPYSTGIPEYITPKYYCILKPQGYRFFGRKNAEIAEIMLQVRYLSNTTPRDPETFKNMQTHRKSSKYIFIKHFIFINICEIHENPHGPKKVSNAQNLCVSPDAIMPNSNKFNR